jgi:hypothetical protein
VITRLMAGASSGASGGVADHDLVVEHDPVGIVEDLSLTCGAPAGQLGDLCVAWLLLGSSRDSPQPGSTATS